MTTLCERWLANVKRHDPLPKENHLFLCSNHFENSCFQRDFKLTFYIIPNMFNINTKFKTSL